MKAIILAAGRGNRMQPLTAKEHKTLLEINGYTIISRIIDGLLENDISDIVIGTGYLADRLRHYLKTKYPNVSLTFINNANYSRTNNIHTLSLIFSQVEINDDVILIESDLIYEGTVLKRIIESPEQNVALVDQYRIGMDGTVVTVSNGIITSIIPPHLQGPNFIFSDKYKTLNIYKFSESFCNHTFKNILNYYASAIDENAYYELILGILIYVQKATIHAEILDGERWAEVDDPNDLEQATFLFSPEKRIEILQKNLGGYWNYNILDFCFIRNMYFPTPAMLSELKNNLDNLLFNYGSKQTILNQKVAYFLLCHPENVNLLNGASQIYPLLRTLYANKKALLPRPTFGEFPRIFPRAGFYDDKVGMSLETIENKAKTSDIIIIVNPNNPTGSFIETQCIVKFARENMNKVIIVDESFVEFAPTKSIIQYIDKYPLENVIVVKSLSKVFGIPGIRLGYVYSNNAAFNQFVSQHIPIWNSNSIAENFLEIILKYRSELALSLQKTICDRELFAEALRTLNGVEEVFESAANFLLVRFKGSAKSLKDLPHRLMACANLYVKDVSHKMDDGKFYLRLAVRKPEENKRFIDIYKEMSDVQLLPNARVTSLVSVGSKAGAVVGSGSTSRLL